MAVKPRVLYAVSPHPSNRRKHTIPIEVIKLALNNPDELWTALDQRPCLVEMTIIDGERIIATFPKTVVYPTSGGEIICSAENFPNYPATLRDTARLFVDLVAL
jgi:hypothetical protein